MDPADGRDLDDGPGPGRRVGPWTIEARLGAGGAATVWRAHDDAGRVAALKILPVHGVDEEALVRLEREHAALARLRHPNVVRALGQGRSGAHAWLALECVEGEDLEALLRRWRDAPPPDRFERAEAIFRQLADALDHIHQLGFVHRDIKPANVLLDRDGVVRLVDFGVVTAAEISRITQVGRLVGTIAYMAPELIAEDPVDARADLYGLGAVLYALLTLHRPIEADSVAGFLARHLTTAPAPPHELDPEVPRRLERIALRLLEKDPARRFPSARAAIEALSSDDAEADRLPGREEALEVWRERVEAARSGTGSVVVVEGPLGSGRSSVLRAWAELARSAGLEVADAGDPAASEAEVVLADDVDRLPPDARRRVEAARADHRLLALAQPPGTPVGPDAVVVRLEPLPRRAIAQLLRDRGTSTAVATALATRLEGTDAAWPGALIGLLAALVREGWLVEHDRALAAKRPLEAFRTADLPVPDADRRALLERARALGPDEREVVELLAVLGRPAAASLLARATDSPARTPAAIDRLLREAWIRAEAGEDDLTLRLSHPAAGTVIREAIAPDDRRARHLALAQVLGRRRRRGSSEAATHLAAAGQHADAMPLFLASARQDLAGGEATVALRTLDEAAAALDAAAETLPPADVDRWRRLIASQRGTALLAHGRWPEAVPALEGALELARASGDERAIGRAATQLGRAFHRLGRMDAAAAALEEALALGEPGTAEVDDARRSLADIHLQHGRLDGAMILLRDALDAAVQRGSRDEEARARRGIAHVLGLEGRFAEATRELEVADDLLASGGDPRVRAGVLRRSLELDVAAGRYALALHRAELLLDLLGAHGLGGSLPDALGATALVRHALGQDDEAAGVARRALMLGRAHPAAAWQGIFDAARVLASLDRLEGDELELVLAAGAGPAVVRRPATQAHALAARLLAVRDPSAARAHLERSDREPRPAWGLAELARLLDAASAEVALGDLDAARARLHAAEALLPDDRCAGLRLDLAERRRLVGEPLAPEALRTLVDTVAAPLPGRLRQTFLRRADLADLAAHEATGATTD